MDVLKNIPLKTRINKIAFNVIITRIQFDMK